MKKFESFLLKSCAYTVLLMLIMYITVSLLGESNNSISAFKFFLLLGYGALITADELIYNTLKIKTALKVLIHYAILLAGFVTVYALMGIAGTVTPMRVFVIIVLFTVFYAMGLGIVKLISTFVKKTDSAIEKHEPKEKEPATKYNPRFGDE